MADDKTAIPRKAVDLRLLTESLLLIAAMCARPAYAESIATVNGIAIGQELFDLYATQTTHTTSVSGLTLAQRSQLLDNLVRAEVVAQQALKDGLVPRDEALDGLEAKGQLGLQQELARLQTLEHASAEHYLRDKNPTQAELMTEYDAQVAAMPKTQYHARHILVTSQDAAQKIIDQLKKGAKFEELAKKESIDSSKEQGGDLGWFSPSNMVKPFADAVATLKKGEYTQTPVQTQYGWHVIQLIETRDTPIPPLDAVRARVVELVQNKKFKAYQDELLKSASVAITRSSGAAADEASDKSALTACVDAHTTPADEQTVGRLLGLVIVTASPSGTTPTDLPQDLLALRDITTTDTANLLTRIMRQDCKSEVQAVVADKTPNGGAFTLILGQLIKRLQQSIQRTGTVMGFDLVKKMDSNVLLELGVAPSSTSQPNDAATSPSGPRSYSRATVSGVRIRLDFAVALNPDCSAVGETIIRIITPPGHGTAAVEGGSGFTSYPSTNQRYHCNEKALTGKILYYKSKSGYTGQDSLTYQTIYPNGVEQQYSVDLTVN